MAGFNNSINTNNTELDILTNGGTLNIGTDAAASTAITIGNANGTTGLTINVGSAGITIPSFTNYGAVVSNSSGLLSDAASTAGYVLTGNSGSAPSFQPAAGGFSWVDQTSGTVTMVAGSGYVVDNGASLVTLTLPALAALGATFQVAGFSSGGWSIAVASGQNIQFGYVSTTTTTGTLSSSNQYDQVTITCVVANTTFVVTASIGNLSYT